MKLGCDLVSLLQLI